MKDAIAVVGMSCRFPGGVHSPEDYWRLLVAETDAVTEVPPDRFSTEFYQHPSKREPGKSYTFAAGVIDDVAGFDAEFFGISPREAQQMDPQQRLLLELAWEAFEHAGHAPQQMAGQDCAVFIGVAAQDYGDRGVDDLSVVDAYSATGNTLSIASNRISYLFDLRGPSMSIDTACSSSLVALHQACNAIRAGEVETALAGGVNLLLHPFPFVSFAKASMLSPNGRCRAFDASGDGYVRAEGGALVMLKSLSKALADGDTIHAVITSSGVNSDGHSQGGINVPASATQAALLENVYARAGIDPRELDYLEAHGTGTAVGDPIETRALIDVIGKLRSPDAPLLIGSAKTNVGHLETASGMAGLIKAILCLKHRAVPASIHFRTPNPNIDFTGGNLRVVDRYTPLPPKDTPLLIGVNSFGFGGTNAHVLLREAAPSTKAVATGKAPDRSAPLMLSARSEDALRALAAAYRDQLNAGISWQALAGATAHRRQPLRYRAVIDPSDTGAATEGVTALAALAQGESTSAVVTGEAVTSDGKLALVFSGNGSQWTGMGQRLLQEDSVFRATVEQIDAFWCADGSTSLLEVMRAGATAEWLQQTENAQPLLFAMQAGIVHSLLAQGLRFDACYGHSVGEVAAAYAAGALSMQQAVRVIKVRSRAQALTAGKGKMAAAGVSESAARELIAELGLGDVLEVAGINSPGAVTLAGSLAALEAVQARLAQSGHFFQVLDLDYAFHSRQMDAIHDVVVEGLRDLQPQATHCTLISTVTGTPLSGTELDASYWWRNIREPVQFEPATRQLIDGGMRLFLEIGPHSILRTYVSQSLETARANGIALPTLKRNHDQGSQLRHAFCAALAHGARLDRNTVYPDAHREIVLPTYPWQRTAYWAPITAEGYDLVHRHREHPLLGYRLKDAAAAWENQIDPVKLPMLASHVVDGAVTFPGAGYAEMALAAARSYFGTQDCAVENLEIRTPVVFQPQQGRLFRLTLDPRTAGFVIETRPRVSDDPWTINVTGRLLVGGPSQGAPIIAPHSLAALEAQNPVAGRTLYQAALALGLEFGEAFRWVQTVRVDGDVALAELAVPASQQEQLARYAMHPGALDSGLHPLLALMAADQTGAGQAAYVPVQFGRMDYFGGVPARVVARIERRSPHSLVASFQYLDAAGHTVLTLSACRFRRVDLIGRRHGKPGRYVFALEAKPAAEDAVSAAAPSPASLLATAAATVAGIEDAAHRDRHLAEVMPLLDVLAAAYALRAVQALDVLRKAELPVCTNPALLARLVDMLLEDGVLTHRDGVLALGDETLPAIEDLWRSLLSLSPGHVAELTLLAHCGASLPAVLRGTLEAAAVLPSTRNSLLDHLFEASPTWSHVNAMTCASLDACIEGWTERRPMRVLEIVPPQANLFEPIGARVQGLCDYTIAGSAEQLGAFDTGRHPLIRTATLQLGEQPALTVEAGRSGTFDVVVINNLLRASDKPQRLLAALRTWMTPGALLVLSEAQASRFSDIVFGLSPEWWFASRGDLLPTESIEAMLLAEGFQAPARHVEADLQLEGAPVLLLARRQLGRPADSHDIDALAANEEHPAANWLVVCPGAPAELATTLAAAIAGANPADGSSRVALVDSPEAALAHAALDDTAVPCQIVFLAADAPQLDADVDATKLMQAQEPTSVALARLVRGLSGKRASVRLSIVTRGGAPLSAPDTPATALQPAQATLWGLGRVLMNEYAELHCRLIDIDPRETQPVPALSRELLCNDAEDEVVLGLEARYVSRMLAAEVGELREQAARAAAGASAVPAVLGFKSAGSLSHLEWFPLPAFALEPDEVEVEPVAAGLNFRDVMYAMGLLSDEAVENGFAGPTIGMEFSGRVTRVGSAVTAFAVGDPVLGFAPACYASRLRTRATALAHKPARLSFEEAATIPTTFFTAHYALNELARIRKGERVLVHGAAGGVGIAAVQLARHLGAEVFATASSNEKREFVRLLGASRVFDSRSLAFADDIRSATGGEGVDVVLNSLAGEAMVRSIDVLRPFGRFLELGKRDFYENSRIGLRPFRNNISYFGIDADQLMDVSPQLTAALFTQVMALLEQGVLDPLPYRAFPVARIEDAFRYMQQARQIGKIVVTFAEGVPAPQNTDAPHLALDPSGAYLVAGGTGGLGFATARWLVERGARHVVLASRRGTLAPELAEEAARWRDTLQVETTVVSCDLNDGAAVQALVDKLGSNGTPLKGLVHSAMTIADGLIANLDDAAMRDVLAPKVAGAWNLHQATRGLALDFFVVYSSATTFLGNPGQSNYVAANAFLEALVHQRRALGLPGTYMAWGPLEDVGFLARNAQTLEALQGRIGGRAITSAQAMAALEQVLLRGQPGEAVLWLDWKSISRVMPAARSLRYLDMRSGIGQETQRADGAGMLIEIRALALTEAVQLVIETLQAQIARILHLSAAKIDPDRSVTDLGMDSLMGMELGMAIEECFEVKLPVMMLAEGATVRSLAQKIAESVRAGASEGQDAGAASEMEQQLASLSAIHGTDLSSEDLQKMASELRTNRSINDVATETTS
ncbi:type I polyketide synthase [Ralstonia insidiosa]|jgi:phthiocerol/phenolphthiocerol synthesis type-I polyketide synthase C|nr:type I polyketide synthase [Ralstonia insidiosa]KMW47025.1 beta-ketoacyl synthase [Ralstonia sp. MD27]MBX3775481.1 type I polyketide synthase [Ralstonia pickettii]NPA01102.1 type I polyketide synthase [Betaproteobacteria bacterium]MBA9859673.1 type I polyketide synthase [Ralstonia insidiosa]MBA9873213.1 type I polyketide synthase [Ralstonia insidiosa]